MSLIISVISRESWWCSYHFQSGGRWGSTRQVTDCAFSVHMWFLHPPWCLKAKRERGSIAHYRLNPVLGPFKLPRQNGSIPWAVQQLSLMNRAGMISHCVVPSPIWNLLQEELCNSHFTPAQCLTHGRPPTCFAWMKPEALSTEFSYSVFI